MDEGKWVSTMADALVSDRGTCRTERGSHRCNRSSAWKNSSLIQDGLSKHLYSDADGPDSGQINKPCLTCLI